MIQVGSRVRATKDHQLGFVVEDQAGRLAVKLDRRHETVVPFRKDEWIEETERPISPIQVARIAYEADRALRTILGDYGVKEWGILPEPDRVRMLNGPPKGADPRRVTLWTAITKAIGGS